MDAWAHDATIDIASSMSTVVIASLIMPLAESGGVVGYVGARRQVSE